ncbi:hypothetical protein ASPACDRAFT_122273 [Aspergillus aculeatus ATCC 16872]|uniref:ZZ-type domain-containing protein n=1 Tax=Aspergillus aculeatus (strain ATCC 16872 / CBS 172.66 / WB 5094) TaxID=690307 RepID=A0A1L9WQK7_ASPA1|nr:uncharacterized protein ASPACDRAFT_122273 [Aspergillus aculeatus ATCC 16872]OJJ98474.1 hypothetical protein ASPACDRAFT_122273 [Aspergillus aculeatus ATCC 16872]
MSTLVSAAWEAARYRQSDLLKELLDHCTLNSAQMHDILWAANWSADEEVIDLVVSCIIRSTRSESPFEWPDFILIRAATLNSTSLLAKLLDAGASVHGKYDYEGDIYLHSAVFWSAAAGHLDSLKFFLGRAAIADRLYSRRRQLLHITSAHGHVGAVRLLLAAGADINALGGDDGQSVLCRACQWGYYSVVQELVKHPELELDKHGDVRWTPLAAAVDQGYVHSVRLLLERGADPNVLGSVNWSPLQFAIYKGHDHITKLLLEHGANPHVTKNEIVPLPEAAGAGKLELVKLLVEAGHPVDAPGTYNRTALLRAAYSGHREVAEYLISKGAQATLSDQGNSNGLHLAAEKGHAGIIRLLSDHGTSLNQVSEAGWTPLHIAYSQPQATRALLEKGANPNIVAWNWTPLALSATYNQTENVRTLLEFGPDLEVQYGDDPYNGYTALGCAVKKERLDSVRLLLEAGANVDHQGSKGQTPLHDAVRLDNPALIQLLLEFRPDVNHAQQEGFTPLMYMSPSTRMETLRPLINAGADLEARNRKGLSVLMCAVGHENAAMVKYLLARGAELNTVGSIRGGPLHYACWDSSLDMVKLLVAAGADINLVDPQNGSPLHQAAYRGPFGEWEHQSKICKYLLSLEELDVNSTGSMRGSLLSWICVTAPLEIVTALLDKGARVDQPDIQGRTAIHLAAANSVSHLDLIFEQGGDIEARDHVGRTVLHFAILSGSAALVERVLSLSCELLDAPDDDGWTPLLWAARGWTRLSRTTTASVQEEIISMLLNRGANPCTQWVGLGRTWSAAKIARYHGHSGNVVRLLEDAYQTAHPQADALEIVGIHFSRVAASFRGTCDGCFMGLYGYRYKCQVCFDFDLCYKCFLTRHKTHDGHDFSSTEAEEKYVEEPEEEGGGGGDANSTTHGSSSDVQESEDSDSDKDSDVDSSSSD